jgi:serine/threonine-protein kinase
MLAPPPGSTSATALVTDTGRTYAIGAVFGSYRLVREIGGGGMGHVFIAEHTRLGRQVAVKILRSEYSDNRDAVRRFFAEAQAVNRINHENIIEVSDFIESPRGPSLYVMELLKGKDLRSLAGPAGVLPLRRALAIVVQVCRGLGAAHDVGIIHRDLKPDNIFLVQREGRSDFVKLLDFGVAKLMNAALDDPSTFKSMAGIVVGTPAYMAPEQAMGQPVDHRADIYSLGVIMFELVTGQRPFLADSAREVMAKHMMETPQRPNKLRRLSDAIPMRLEALILACLKKEPRDRPQSIKEVEQRVRDVLEDLPEEGGQRKGFGRHLRDRRLWAGAAVAVMALGAVSVVGLVGATRKPKSPAVAVGRQNENRPTPAAAAPRPKVEISFVSSPAGARVFRAGSDQPLGMTPFSAAFEPSTGPQVFEFYRDGWQVGRRTVSLNRSGEVEVTLVPATPATPKRLAAVKRPGAAPIRKPAGETPAVAPRTDPRPSVKLDSDIVLNPFE